MVYFRITTQDGRRFVGSVQGFGGQLGGNAAHRGPEVERRVALADLQASIDHLNETGRWLGNAMEAREAPGHCIVTSVHDWKVPHDGKFNQCLVPLQGAGAAVLSDEEVRQIPPGTCREDQPDPKAAIAAQLMRRD